MLIRASTKILKRQPLEPLTIDALKFNVNSVKLANQESASMELASLKIKLYLPVMQVLHTGSLVIKR